MNVKKLLVFFITLLIMLTVAVNVYATELSPAEKEDAINYLKSKSADSINFTIREDEYRQVPGLIYNQIKESLETDGKVCEYIDEEDGKRLIVKNFPNEDYEANIIIGYGVIADVAEINQAVEYITIYNKNNTFDIVNEHREFEITYKIHENYNVADKEAVDNLDLNPNKRYIISYNDAMDNISLNGYIENDIIEKYYLKDINDETVTIELLDFAGYGGEISSCVNAKLLIFKNGILYKVLQLENQSFITSITVTKTLATEKNFTDYLTKKLKPVLDNLKEYLGNLTIEVTKGITAPKDVGGDVFKEFPNVYTIAFKNSSSKVEEYEFILINIEGEEKAEIQVEDNITNVILDATSEVVPKNTKLIISKLENGTKYENAGKSLKEGTEKFVVYDITLESEGVSIQPDGKVKISIPIPSEFGTKNIVVYRVEDDGTKTKYEVKIETINGKTYAVFETDHFSIYTVAQEKEETVTETTSTEKEETATAQKTNNPKTGDGIIYTIGILFISIIGMVTVIMLNANRKQEKH